MSRLFENGCTVMHVTGGGIYRVDNNDARMERTLEPAYVYTSVAEGGFTWVRPTKEFEDGRFVRVE